MDFQSRPMTANTLSFDTLPYALQLEICYYLDLESLVALSQISTTFRNLSNSFRTYWIPTILRDHIALPLASHLPLTSFAASELHLASHKALFCQRNLASANPRLYSHTLVEWPWCPARIAIKETDDTVPTAPELETADDALWRHLAHPNGEWMFVVSSDAVVRILHLRSKTLAWEKQYGDIVIPLYRHGSRARFAVDFMGDEHAMMVLATNEIDNAQYYEEEEEGLFTPGELRDRVFLRVFRVKFNAQIPSAILEEVAKYSRDAMPINLDIAGDYVLYTTALGRHRYEAGYGAGDVTLFRWSDGVPINLPMLMPSVVALLFRSYFFSVGFAEPKSIHLQVISLPHTEESGTHEAQSSGTQNDADYFRLVASIRIPPKYRLHNSKLAVESIDVSHMYMGKAINIINIWIRSHRPNRSWNIFSLEADFSKPPDQWFERYQTDSKEAADEVSVSAIEHRWLLDRPRLVHWASAAPPGRRFTWATNVPAEQREPEEEDMLSDSSTHHRLRRSRKTKIGLWTSVIEHLPIMQDMEKLPPDYLIEKEEASEAIPVQEMETPEDYVMDRKTDSIYSTDLEERCGTVISIMSNGNIWVLRYGYS